MEGGVNYKEVQRYFWGDVNGLHLDCDSSYTIVCVCYNSQNCTLKR